MDKQTQKKLLEIVKRNYEEIAEDFSETRKKHLWPELLQLTQDIKNGDKILDVGCGSGRLLEVFKDRDIKYIGIDSSEKLIDIAQKSKIPGHAARSGAGKNQKSKFIICDILELSKIPEISFDYVFSVAVLHHLPGEDLRVAALKQLKNKIKPEGKIIITVWNLWSQKKFRKIIIRTELLKLFNKLKLMFRRKRSGKSQIAECRALSISGDFGDIIFDWKNSKGEKTSRRYYHAFRKRELKKITKKAGLRIEKIYNDKFNYYAILKK
ncbi:MAG: class I SAM-dependent methyltransferase [bacterium]|nr:class I SAM-dependent methyltransferase [bacterium]